MRSLLFLLVVSLAANGWLVLRRSSHARDDSRALAPPSPTGPAQPAQTQPAKNESNDLVHAMAQADRTDLESLISRLRTAGADDPTIRGVLDGVVRQRYRAAVAEWRSERWRTAWWKGSSTGSGGMPSMRAAVTDVEKKLLGNDPLDVEDVAARYDFLSPEKRRLLALIDLDYGDLQKSAGGMFSRATTKTEAAEEELLSQERRKDLLAALTPEERVEYDLRFGGTATLNASRFATMNATEAEFRAVKPLLDAHQAASRTAAQSSDRATIVITEQRTVDQIVAAIGYDRALDFLWGVSGPYDDIAQLLRESHRPVGNAARVFQLAADAGEQAAAIHYDGSLTTDQKRAALAALQQSIRPQFDRLVSPADQARLPEPAIGWFRLLGEGRYEQPRPMLSGSGRMVAAPVSVMAPVNGKPPAIPLARPPPR